MERQSVTLESKPVGDGDDGKRSWGISGRRKRGSPPRKKRRKCARKKKTVVVQSIRNLQIRVRNVMLGMLRDVAILGIVEGVVGGMRS